MKYLVTWSDTYYPCKGAYDWVEMFNELADASTFAKGFAKAKNNSGTVVVIAIDFANNSWHEVARLKTEY